MRQYWCISTNTGTASSPRLSSTESLSALLTIIDDEAGAGLFRLQPTTHTVQEESGRVSFSILREGGSQGRVTIMIQTVDGNAEDASESVANTVPSYMYYRACGVYRALSLALMYTTTHHKLSSCSNIHFLQMERLLQMEWTTQVLFCRR